MACPHCHVWNTTGNPCAITVCLGCGTPVCMSHGSRRGTCPVCLHGGLPGWSGIKGQLCGYKGCPNEAVFFEVPRVKRCCLACASRARIHHGKVSVALADLVQTYIRNHQLTYVRSDCAAGMTCVAERFHEKAQELNRKAQEMRREWGGEGAQPGLPDTWRRPDRYPAYERLLEEIDELEKSSARWDAKAAEADRASGYRG